MLILRWLIAVSGLVFILLQRIDVKITRHAKPTVKISFNILALVLTEDNIKKTNLKRIRGLIRNLIGALKAFGYLISKSDVVIVRYERNVDEAISSPINQARLIATSQFTTSYFDSKAKSLSFVNENKPKDTSFDVSFHFSLFNLIISALIFLYYIVKNKVKRVLKHV